MPLALFRKKKVKKTVNFNLEATTALSDPVCEDDNITLNLGDEWWDEEEGLKFQQRDKDLALKMSNEKLSPDDLELKYNESSRGMELQFQENANVIITRKTNSYNAVRSLQQLYQKKKKTNSNNKKNNNNLDEDAKSIARAYSMCCEGAIVDAIRLAKADAQWVQDFVVNNSDDDQTPFKRVDNSITTTTTGTTTKKSSMVVSTTTEEPQQLAKPKKRSFFHSLQRNVNNNRKNKQ